MKFQEDIFNSFHVKHRHNFVTELLLTKFEGEQLGDSNEYPQHKFLWRIEENYPSIVISYLPYLFHC